MPTATITLDDSLKREATDVLNGIGLSLSGYCTLMLCQLANKRRVPFELETADPAPTELTNPGGNHNGHIDSHLSDGLVDVIVLYPPLRTNPIIRLARMGTHGELFQGPLR